MDNIRTIDAYVVSGAMFLDGGTSIFADINDDELREPMRSLFIRARRYWKQSRDPDWALFVKTEYSSDESEAINAAWNAIPTGRPEEIVRLLRLENYREKANEIGISLTTARDEEELVRLTDELVKASQKSKKTKVYANEELYMRFLINMDMKPEYISTGFSILDRMTFIEPGDFIVVAGRPSTGKTAFTLQLMLNMAKSGKKCAYFSLETNADKLYQRAITCFERLNYDHVKMRRLTPEEHQTELQMSSEFLSLPFFFIEAAGMTADMIEHEAVSMGADIIFVDYLGLVQDKAKSRYEKVTNTSLALHTIAQKNNITVVALSQLRRVQGVELKKPRMDDLRESGQIEADADLILMLFNEAKDIVRATPPKDDEPADLTAKRYQLEANPYRLFWVTVEKNKEGITGDIEFNFFGEQQHFTELEEELQER